MNAPMFYMQDSRDLCGTNLMFWRKGGKGYGTNIDELEVYTLEEAQAKHDGRKSDVPLLKSLVDELSIVSVDCQVLPEPCLADENDRYVVQVKGNWNGNDILFVGFQSNTYNYNEAQVFSNEGIDMGDFNSKPFTIFSESSIDKIARRTFQVCNINRRKMISDAGIKFHKPKRVRPTTGKMRGNCSECGRITWGFNPYEDTYCENHSYSYQAAV